MRKKIFPLETSRSANFAVHHRRSLPVLNHLFSLCFLFSKVTLFLCGPGSVVGIATGYGLDGPESNPGGGEIFRTSPDRPWGPPSLLYKRYRLFPGSKERPGRTVTLAHHPLLMPWSRKSRAIPLLPLRAVWPEQSLSACTRMHFLL
jgi:hypothetical protein